MNQAVFHGGPGEKTPAPGILGLRPVPRPGGCVAAEKAYGAWSGWARASLRARGPTQAVHPADWRRSRDSAGAGGWWKAHKITDPGRSGAMPRSIGRVTAKPCGAQMLVVAHPEDMGSPPGQRRPGSVLWGLNLVCVDPLGRCGLELSALPLVEDWGLRAAKQGVNTPGARGVDRLVERRQTRNPGWGESGLWE
ncbi:hypothetical protein NDU88_006348 [Pleurodeles waltl]|uniref:Uncharacterized protein n=1 Tax=Pleurodeles waltl TaxID=8319 RepID=A0AAV7TFC3_PLEWA|nr:hypothetical protein NDU88_006348 [Pleurodeles waltl]